LTSAYAAGNFRGMTVITKTVDRETVLATSARPVWPAVKCGWKQTCPACAKGALYKSYLKVNDTCPSCGEELHHQRADDAPPYFVIFIVAHVIGAIILFFEKNYPFNMWLEAALCMPIVIGLSLWLLPRVKGALIAYQWANRMHGFGGGEIEGVDIAAADPLPAVAP
jgi:uncharacterized protein (DUF983 family)